MIVLWWIIHEIIQTNLNGQEAVETSWSKNFHITLRCPRSMKRVLQWKARGGRVGLVGPREILVREPLIPLERSQRLRTS